MWLVVSSSTSSCGWQWARTATWLDIVPDGTNSPASMPNRSAVRRSSSLTVGSSPKTSSPTAAAVMAASMPGVGRVTVSLRRSIGVVMVRLRGGGVAGRCGVPQGDLAHGEQDGREEERDAGLLERVEDEQRPGRGGQGVAAGGLSLEDLDPHPDQDPQPEEGQPEPQQRGQPEQFDQRAVDA